MAPISSLAGAQANTNPIKEIAEQQPGRDPDKSDQEVFGDDFDSFLTLLTTQLQNQDPLDPMDTHQFTSQLVEFSQVEQAIKSNDKLEDLIDVHQTSAINTAAAMTGKIAETTSNRARFDPAEGPLRFAVDVPSSVEGTTVEIVNDSGQTVHSFTGPSESGREELAWDGTTASGGLAPAGTYEVRVVGNAGPDTEPESVSVSTFGHVDGAMVEEGEIVLEIAGGEVPLDQVKSIRAG